MTYLESLTLSSDLQTQESLRGFKNQHSLRWRIKTKNTNLLLKGLHKLHREFCLSQDINSLCMSNRGNDLKCKVQTLFLDQILLNRRLNNLVAAYIYLPSSSYRQSSLELLFQGLQTIYTYIIAFRFFNLAAYIFIAKRQTRKTTSIIRGRGGKRSLSANHWIISSNSLCER